VSCLARDLPEPSPLSHEILNARPYAFLDDAPLEERRAAAVATRRASEPTSAAELGALDPAAIARVREEAWPDARTPDELHDALHLAGFLTQEEGGKAVRREGGKTFPDWTDLLAALMEAGRAGRGHAAGCTFWITAERLAELRAVHPDLMTEPASLEPPAGVAPPDRETAIRELIRSRMEILGPTTVAALADSLGADSGDVGLALAALEHEGVVLRGTFTDNGQRTTDNGVEWCDRRLLARIHRYTLTRLRAEIEPVSAADFLRFLFVWQRLVPEQRAAGLEGLAAVIERLDGFELAAGAWETDVLASRVDEYDPQLLDALCLTGRVAWGRLSVPAVGGGPAPVGPVRSTPISILLREHRDAWLSLAAAQTPEVSSYGAAVRDALTRHGALFFQELAVRSGLLATQAERGLAELVAAGLVTADSFAGLRALLTPEEKRRPMSANAHRRHRPVAFGVETAGRWSLLRPSSSSIALHPPEAEGRGGASPAVGSEEFARVLLKRYGVIFHRLLARESLAPPWRDLLRVYRRLEARGEIRGGRFVAGMAGEQFALPEAVAQLRAVRRAAPVGELVSVSAADPLNLTGIVTPEARVPALASNRVLFRDGVAIAVREARETRHLAEPQGLAKHEIERALVRKRVSPALRGYLGSAG
jgi:ATP-dependent Lhr-like helicase